MKKTTIIAIRKVGREITSECEANNNKSDNCTGWKMNKNIVIWILKIPTIVLPT